MERLSSRQFQRLILGWYRAHGRHTLPWRSPALKLLPDGAAQDPYRVVVSELMLQQTQVDRVIPKYISFLKAFPTLPALARASVADVLKEWKGLGYNRRALFLKRAAERVCNDFGGIFPRRREDIESLRGIGPYTARAISVFAFNAPETFIETNIRRVFIHFFFQRARKVSDADIMPHVQKTLFVKDPRTWYSALMDYGALEMKTMQNPNKKSAHYTRQSPFEGSTRYARSHILEYILYKECVSARDMMQFFSDDPHMKQHLSEKNMTAILNKMRTEGLIYERDGFWLVSPL